MENTWVERDLPVLDSVVRRLDQSLATGGYPDVADVASDTGLTKVEVAQALKAMDGAYVDLRQVMSGPDFGPWYVTRVTPEARRAVGQWPSPDQFVDALVEALNSASEHEPDETRRSRLRQAAGTLGSVGRGVATEVATKVILGGIGV